MAMFLDLDALTIEEGSCLLRSDALSKIRENDAEVVVLHYFVDPHRKVEGRGASKTAEEDANKPERCGMSSKVPNGLSGLYVDGSTRIKPEYSEGEDVLVVIDSVGCDLEQVERFIHAVVETIQPDPDPSHPAIASRPYPDPSGVLESASLDRREGFITGISLRAAAQPTEFLTLFVSIPYLGIGTRTPTRSGSRTLSQYRLRDTAGGSSGAQVMVHQTWFLVFNNETIGIFRSENDKYSDRAPLFAYQKRVGGFHALVHMLSNTFTGSEKEVLRMFSEKVTNAERIKSDGEFRGYITDVFTMMQVVRSQIENLENLGRIFKNSYDMFEPTPQRNEFEIPFMHGRNEQMTYAMKSITAILAEREKFYKKLKNWVKELELLRSLFLQEEQGQKQNRNQEKKEKAQETMQETLRNQGQTITVFTLVTSIFLPLGFLSSYYGMNPPGFQQTIKTVEQFWKVSAPTTIVVVLIMSLFMYSDDKKIKDWLTRVNRRFGDVVTRVCTPKIGTRKDSAA